MIPAPIKSGLVIAATVTNVLLGVTRDVVARTLVRNALCHPSCLNQLLRGTDPYSDDATWDWCLATDHCLPGP